MVATHEAIMQTSTDTLTACLASARSAKVEADDALVAAISAVLVDRLSLDGPPMSMVVTVEGGTADPASRCAVEEIHFDDTIATLEHVDQRVLTPAASPSYRLIELTHDDDLASLLEELVTLRSGVADSDGHDERFAYEMVDGSFVPVDLVGDALHRLRWSVVTGHRAA